MSLPIWPPYPPMEGTSADDIPAGSQWQYEPKWDGFRCLAFRDGPRVQLQSKAMKPLARYFPELVAAIKQLKRDSICIRRRDCRARGEGIFLR
jgi:ATP-dependent DNA ligase